MATMEEFVERAAALFAEAEDKASAAYNATLELPHLMTEGRELGMAGYLESSHMKNQLRTAAGKIADGLAIIFEVHRHGTEIAQRIGVDLPQPRDGGGGR